MTRHVCVLLVATALSAQAETAAIKVDQVGYKLDTPKFALLVTEGAAAALPFTVRRLRDNKEVLRGNWTAPVFDADSGDPVRTADFTSLRDPGDYYLESPGIGRSFRFKISSDLYQHAYFLAARAFYGQRCGAAVDLTPDFPGYHHDICHTAGAFDPSSGQQGPHASQKGWHDAGDYGRYIVNSGISTATLLWAAELWDQKIRNQSLHLPESGNGTPDLLNEARWNIDWMLTMQDTDGGVWHKQTSAHFCGFIPPEADKLPSLVIGAGQPPFKTSCATADFAAVTAIAARAFARYDKPYAAQCLLAARKAWSWLESHPHNEFKNPPGIATGEYGDNNCSDEQLWAAAELARTTGETPFEDYFAAHYREFLNEITPGSPPSWAHMSDFALWTYVLGKGRNAEAVAAIQQQSIKAADAIVIRAANAPYRTTMQRHNYVWGSNGTLANYSLQLLIANLFHPDASYLATAAENVHYLLGRNPFSLSYVTQLGANPVKHIHHRPSADPAHKENPWPGLLSGGPNPGRQDPLAKKFLSPDTPPARAFLDQQQAYSVNEVAINWNAPLVFTLAGLL